MEIRSTKNDDKQTKSTSTSTSTDEIESPIIASTSNHDYILSPSPSPSSSSKLDKNFQRFSEWLHCMCVVTFDLELGQAMELIYPNATLLTEQEKMNICYLAFPDSNSSCMGDTQYHIRLRLSPDNNDELYQLNSKQMEFRKNCIVVQKPDLAHYWGFVYFRQKRDATIARGYFQKSLIILTRLPFFNLFYEILSQIAPRYFNDGIQILDCVYDEICKWPSLIAGDEYHLNILGNQYQTMIPKSNSKKHCTGGSNSCSSNNSYYSTQPIQSPQPLQQQQSPQHIYENDNDELSCNNYYKNNDMKLLPQVLTSVHEIDIFNSLSCHITNIYTLWELVLTSEPIVVIGSSPSDCSSMVQSLISLINPLSYLSESRPYFTIHDSEFKEFTSSYQNHNQLTIPSIIIGVTNPFFNKLLQNWPHMIKLPDHLYHPTFLKYDNITNSNDFINNKNLNQLSTTTTPITTPIPTITTPIPTITTPMPTITPIGNVSNYIKNNSIMNNNDNTPGLHTKYKPYLKRDKNFIKKIQLGMKTKRPIQVQSALLRRHFLELTQSFMIPLERYMASLMPLQKDISPFKSAPNPNQFKQDDFLMTLELSGPQLTTSLKGNWKGLYKKFFKSINFKGWYDNRHTELKHTLQALQLQALSDADLNKWAQGKQEVEIIDMILKLKQKLKLANNSQLVIDEILNPITQLQLIKQLDNITNSLPDDLKIIINNSS